MLRAIERKFEELKSNGKKAFIPFITAGDPDLETTIRLVFELERAGSHVIELGIPFSDPLADGPTIQRSSERALRHGYCLADYLQAVTSIRRQTTIPLVFFSYFNPILQYGLERLARDARAAGVDGILVTDMTPEEADDYCSVMEQHELDPIFLVAPTSSAERVGRIVQRARGFVYLISRTGVTGERENFSDSVVPTLRRVRERSPLPVAVGFGISTPEQVRAVWDVAEGAVVGSAIVARIERLAGSSRMPAQVGEYCRWLTEARNG
jgi:tryptophan synthase alpha chain